MGHEKTRGVDQWSVNMIMYSGLQTSVKVNGMLVEDLK